MSERADMAVFPLVAKSQRPFVIPGVCGRAEVKLCWIFARFLCISNVDVIAASAPNMMFSLKLKHTKFKNLSAFKDT